MHIFSHSHLIMANACCSHLLLLAPNFGFLCQACVTYMILTGILVSSSVCYFFFLFLGDFFFIVNVQGLAILAFNDGQFNAKTLREVLSLGPTFFVMKFFESMCQLSFIMYFLVIIYLVIYIFKFSFLF